MAVRHRLVRTPARTVWEVLADGSRHADWLVGTPSSEPVRGQWPRLGSAIHYETRIGPLRLAGETVVRRCERGEALEFEAREGPLGTARIAVRLRPWGNECLVTVDEHPLRGADGRLRRAAVRALARIRHGALLARLAEVCEADAAEWERRRPLGQVVASEPGRDGTRA
ncbi:MULTISPECIES: SRPBCC family protein [unclassified Streptomyces]|uniref:SRPBCC family protein n=1 Tax=unclassified Streptomyces TaxID=2593676 RepID=UPI0005A81A9E|nr:MULTISPECIES: SRPBCC family protein [unclassified Streptomyces]ODA72295.1 Polyketide cyclase / dehydrase and lipid transport [Streptomyces sp. AVP053U2]